MKNRAWRVLASQGASGFEGQKEQLTATGARVPPSIRRRGQPTTNGHLANETIVARQLRLPDDARRSSP